MFKRCCLLNDARKLRLVADPEDMDFRIVMSTTVHNLVKNCHIPTQEEKDAYSLRLAERQKLLSTGNKVVQEKTTSHVQSGEELIGNEEADVPPLAEVDFTPKKFFSFSDSNKRGDDDVFDYDTDSQKGDLNGSPSSLQLNFDNPFSFHKGLSACVALLKNSSNFLGTEEMSIAQQATEGQKAEEEGTSLDESISYAQAKSSPENGFPPTEDKSFEKEKK